MGFFFLGIFTCCTIIWFNQIILWFSSVKPSVFLVVQHTELEGFFLAQGIPSDVNYRAVCLLSDTCIYLCLVKTCSWTKKYAKECMFIYTVESFKIMRHWSSNPSVNPALPCPWAPCIKYLQRWWFHHFYVQPVLTPENPFSEELFPDMKSKPHLAQLEAVSSYAIACCLK